MPPNVRRGIKRAARSAGRALKPIAKAAVKAAKQELRNQLGVGAGRLGARALRASRMLLSGQGDYHANSIVSGSNTATTPSFGTTRITMKRRELIGQVVSSSVPGAFTLQKFTVNPADPTTFPWLSQVASVFETWRPNGMAFEFKSTSGTAVGSTNTALGSVILAPQYNPFAMDPINLVQLEGYTDVVVTVPFENAICGVECNPANRQAGALLVRNANVPAFTLAADTLFDLCDFYVASAGCQGADIVLGEIWVVYSIDLWNPIVPVAPPVPSAWSTDTFTSSPALNNIYGGTHSASTMGSGTQWNLAFLGNSADISGLVPGRFYVASILLYENSTLPAITRTLGIGGGAHEIASGTTGVMCPSNAIASSTTNYMQIAFQVDSTVDVNITLSVTVGVSSIDSVVFQLREAAEASIT
jgi:hypothetical protein